MGHGAQLDAKDKDDQSAIHKAAASGNNDIVNILIKSGAKINLLDKDGDSPLHYASRTVGTPTSRSLTMIKCFIENGAKLNIKNNKGETPLDVAYPEEIKQYLLEKQTEAATKETVTNQDPCIICHGPRNGFYVLMPCGHASLCEDCCKKITKDKFGKCPSCRRPTKSYTKIFY